MLSGDKRVMGFHVRMIEFLENAVDFEIDFDLLKISLLKLKGYEKTKVIECIQCVVRNCME